MSSARLDDLDEFARCAITRKEDIRDLFVPKFFFGCEGDDRMTALAYTLAELRQAFSGIHLEAHALAAAYGWPETAILALPRSRRRRYASMIADERRAG
jgi:hypothetical protein